jgi:hypothetical protein
MAADKSSSVTFRNPAGSTGFCRRSPRAITHSGIPIRRTPTPKIKFWMSHPSGRFRPPLTPRVGARGSGRWRVQPNPRTLPRPCPLTPHPLPAAPQRRSAATPPHHRTTPPRHRTAHRCDAWRRPPAARPLRATFAGGRPRTAWQSAGGASSLIRPRLTRKGFPRFGERRRCLASLFKPFWVWPHRASGRPARPQTPRVGKE